MNYDGSNMYLILKWLCVCVCVHVGVVIAFNRGRFRYYHATVDGCGKQGLGVYRERPRLEVVYYMYV